jgi:hypothetical protein
LGSGNPKDGPETLDGNQIAIPLAWAAPHGRRREVAMATDLMPWLVGWAFVITGVVILIVWRFLVAREERGGIFIEPGEERELDHQVRIGKTLARIDLWGQTLTVISALLMAWIAVIWLRSVWEQFK